MSLSSLLRPALTALVAVCLLVSAVAVPTAAQTDGGPLDALTAHESDGSVDWSATALRTINGIQGAVLGEVAAARDAVADALGTDDSPTASEAADDLAQVVNDNSSALVEYANGRLTPTNGTDVLALEFTIGEDTATRYLVAEHSSGNWTGVSVVTETSRTVDEECTLSGDAAEDAGAELATALETFIAADEPPSATYLGRVTGEYRREVECTVPGV